MYYSKFHLFFKQFTSFVNKQKRKHKPIAEICSHTHRKLQYIFRT